jgi:hypothetical protein
LQITPFSHNVLFHDLVINNDVLQDFLSWVFETLGGHNFIIQRPFFALIVLGIEYGWQQIKCGIKFTHVQDKGRQANDFKIFQICT